MGDEQITFRLHAIQRMFQRSIGEEDVREALEIGELIEDYPDDMPYPSQLILGWVGARPLHVVVARNDSDNERIIITVYVPDPKQWEQGYRRRRP